MIMRIQKFLLKKKRIKRVLTWLDNRGKEEILSWPWLFDCQWITHTHTLKMTLLYFPGWSMAPGFIYLLFCWVESSRVVASQGRRLCRNDSTCCPTENCLIQVMWGKFGG
jgi:hypothetical protein